MSGKQILKQMGIQQWRVRENSDLVIGATQEKVNAQSEKEVLTTPQGDAGIIVSEQVKPVKTEFNVEPKTEPLAEPIKMTWSGLARLLDDTSNCPSCAISKPILGEGDANAQWMFVFDSPNSRDIDHQQLLTGRQGQLFDSILSALSLDRKKIYLSSIFKCPPAEDVMSEMPQCNDLLLHQIRLVEPKVIIAFGEFVSQSLIKANEKLEYLRQQPRQHFDQPISVIPTYGLMEMLESPILKGETWEDLKTAIQIIANR